MWPLSANPVWGSRGIAYGHAPGPTSIRQLWMIQPDGTRALQITHLKQRFLAHGLQPFEFSADGEHLLADYSGRRARGQTWTIDINTRRLRQIRLGARIVTPDGISKDGTLLLVEQTTFSGMNEMIETIPWTGGKANFLAYGQGANWNR